MPTSLFATSWQRAWRALDVTPAADALMRQLLAHYAEPHRRYHTQQHLAECLAQFEGAQHLAAQPGEVALALWFHDAIYDVQRHDNEQHSAEWARAALCEGGVAPEPVERVVQLVMATRHAAMPQPGDACLMVDIDLAILGAPPARFNEYEVQVRGEYAHVAEDAFRSGRRRILQNFLARPVLYNTPHFYGLLESAARRNLLHSIAALAD